MSEGPEVECLRDGVHNVSVVKHCNRDVQPMPFAPAIRKHPVVDAQAAAPVPHDKLVGDMEA